MDEQTIEQIEQVVGYKFSDRALLNKAFTHSSAVDDRYLSNERLEFLGDSVLATVICQTLFKQFENYLEGDLTKIKSTLVSRRTCAKVTKELNLLRFLEIGKGMVSNRALTGSITAALLEAIIGAIYIDGGFEPASDFIKKTFASLINQTDAKQAHGNFKSLLQQYAQQHLNTTPVYELLDEKGPDHDKCFESGAVIANHHFPSAWGINKKEAEQKAAFNALVELGVLEETPADITT